ncbi:MAG: zinc ribbon domain-containing protein, partial [Thermoplasmata archaeon]|nr:zinc ribbon domain-containing protein [Thermoplasmata archaeon]
AAIVFITTGFVFAYLWIRLRRQRAQLANEPTPSREQLEDRAFNQIQIARAAAERLERSGVDLGGVPTLLDNAEKARARGDPDTATALARSAQESLVRLRTTPASRVPVTGGDSGAPGASALPSAPSPDGAWMNAPTGAGPVAAEFDPTPPEAPVGRLPKNKAESRFQLSLLDEEVRKAEATAPAAAATTESRHIHDDGRSAFDRGDYTEALRLGLRGRRRVGGRLETLAPSRATQSEPGDDDVAPPPSSPPDRSGQGVPPTCGSCGAPLKASDGFCRACGTPRHGARCAKCGESLSGTDKFCGVCGTSIGA